MAYKEFSITVNGKPQKVTVDHKFLMSDRKIWINDRLEHSSNELLDFGSVHDFYSNDEVVTVCIYPNLFATYTIDLFVNNVSKVTGKTVEDIPRKIAPWAWIFVIILLVACVVIFPLGLGSLNGGIVGALAGLGAGYTIITTKNPYLTDAQRIAISTASTLICCALMYIVRTM
jgi:hypothetical protein